MEPFQLDIVVLYNGPYYVNTRDGKNSMGKTQNKTYKEWVEVPGEEDFLVNEDGLVKIKETGRVTSGRLSGNGYLDVAYMGKVRYVHRLVCAAFHGPPPTERHQVNHIDGVKTNNSYSNLEWVTPRENLIHAWENGLVNNRKPHVVWDVVADTRVEYESLADAAEALGANGSSVRHAKINKSLYRGRYLIREKDDNSTWPDIRELRKDMVLVKNLSTGEVVLYPTAAEVSRAIGVDTSLTSKYLSKGYQYLNGYLIKRYDDNSPWFSGERLKRAIDKSGIGILLYDTREDKIYDFPSVYSAHGFKGFHYAKLARHLRLGEQYAGKGFLIKRQDDPSPWLAEEVVKEYLEREKEGIIVKIPGKKETFIVDTITEASTLTGKALTTIRHHLKKGGGSTTDGYFFIWKDDYVKKRRG